MATLMCVQTIDMKTGRERPIKTIDHDRSEDRQWLAKHAWWAMRSSQKLVTWPIQNDDE